MSKEPADADLAFQRACEAFEQEINEAFPPQTWRAWIMGTVPVSRLLLLIFIAVQASILWVLIGRL
jgi:hypothetical protein